MLVDPAIDRSALASALTRGWGVDPTTFTFVPGYDDGAATYRVDAPGGPHFAKIHLHRRPDPALELPAFLAEAGVPGILAAMRSRASALWEPFGDDGAIVLYPFVDGRDAVSATMTAGQWRTFGSTLRAVHDLPIPRSLSDRLRVDDFDLPAAPAVGRALERARRSMPDASPAHRLAALLRARSREIEAMLTRAATLGATLRGRTRVRVLCHGDIHAANILVIADRGIVLADWDEALIAPRERDLLFVVGSRIARTVQPHEERWFFEGYGPVDIDREALVFYRYERVLEDLAAIGVSVFESHVSDVSRGMEVDLAVSFFEPGGIIETVEAV